MSANAEINDVADTSLWVAYYRAKESARPDALFHDRFARILAGDRGQKIAESMKITSRYTEWAVVSRTVIIDDYIQKLLWEGVDTVINLGAGLDARPYRMKLPENLSWIEVDFPRIIAHKGELLKNEKPVCNLTRIELDLSDDQKRRNFLQNVAPDARKIMVLTEGVIPYLTPEQVAKLAQDLFARKECTHWIGEYFSPIAYPHIQKRVRIKAMKNAPFQFFPEDWIGFFQKHGWAPQEIQYYGDIGQKHGRSMPMPWFAKLLMPFLPKKAREKAGKMSGYMLLKRG